MKGGFDTYGHNSVSMTASIAAAVFQRNNNGSGSEQIQIKRRFQ